MVARIRAVPIGAGLVRLAGVLVGALVASVLSSSLALAQVSPNATVTPVRNTGGFVYIMAFLMAVAGVIVVVVLAAMYLRSAPRFQRTEGGGGVRAPHRVVVLDRFLRAGAGCVAPGVHWVLAFGGRRRCLPLPRVAPRALVHSRGKVLTLRVPCPGITMS